MLRTFNEHFVRAEISLDGWWDFVTAPERADRARLPKRYSRTIHCPRAWETIPGLEAYRGKAWFRRTIELDSEQALRLVFAGVSHTATIFFDGKEVGFHYDAFSPFEIILDRVKAGAHELVVEVDNSFGEHSALHIENDYYTYGGITRPAVMQLLPAVFFTRLHATPRRYGKKWALDCSVTIQNASRAKQSREMHLELAGERYDLGAVRLAPGARKTIAKSITGIDCTPWTADAPVLYDIAAIISEDGAQQDDLCDRIGFREITIKGNKILCNGLPVRLRGYNRHEDHPHYGNALPLEAMVNDLAIIKDLGCNFVRTSHYPNDQRFLDLCDESGIYVWEESHARNVAFTHPKFREQIMTSTIEMIDWHRNHPSILIWGCLNECDSTTKPGRRDHERVLKQIKKMDPSRPVTFASNKGKKDICLDLVDIVSWNRYPGWYGREINQIEPDINDMLSWLNSKASNARGKPVIISEFGAGALYGYRAPHKAKWTEEYMSDVLDESLRVYLNHPAISGAAIWQFCDVRITRGFFAARPRTMNNKGTVDEFRRPKQCYSVVKRRMHDAAAAWDKK